MNTTSANWMRSGSNYTVVIGGRVVSFDDTHTNFNKLVECLKGDMGEFLNLYDIKTSIQTFGGFDLDNESDIIPDELIQHVIELQKDGFDAGPMQNFVANLRLNPSYRSVQQLFKFKNKQNMPITPDGCFLAYKGVNSNYTDKHTGKFSNKVGFVVEMPRNAVCDDPDQSCASGFHVGSLSYAKDWGDRVVIVKVNPRDVVSVPSSECDNKCRVCRYEVIADFVGELCGPYSQDDDDYDYDDCCGEYE